MVLSTSFNKNELSADIIPFITCPARLTSSSLLSILFLYYLVAASGFEPELWEPKSQVLAVTPCGNLWEERDSNPLTASPLRQFVNAGQIYSLLPLTTRPPIRPNCAAKCNVPEIVDFKPFCQHKKSNISFSFKKM